MQFFVGYNRKNIEIWKRKKQVVPSGEHTLTNFNIFLQMDFVWFDGESCERQDLTSDPDSTSQLIDLDPVGQAKRLSTGQPIPAPAAKRPQNRPVAAELGINFSVADPDKKNWEWSDK